MKPKNATLGASPLRVSRVTDIDVDNKAWDSVVFQQSKSLLDFDLNVMQRIMQDSVRKLSQSLVPSGFVSTVKILQPVSNNSIIYLAPNRVSVSGTILRIIDPNGLTQTIDAISYPKCIKIDSSLYNDGTLSAANSVFVWIESWFQEIVPSLVDESFDGVSTAEKKLTTVYQYGNDPNTWAGNTASTALNELKDTTFGAETTRRIQVRWRIRLSPKINSNTYTKGFSDQDATLSSNSLIWAQGGRQNCVFSASFSSTTMDVTAVTSGYVAIGMTITGPGVPDNTYVSAFQSGASGSTGKYTISQPVNISVSQTVFGWFTKSYTFTRSDKLTDTNANDFVLDSDQNVYIAGSGSPSDALALNTVDGRVYGIPLGFFISTGIFSNIAPNSSPGNDLGTISATNVSLGINNLRLNANSIGIAGATGQSPAASSGPLTVDTGTGTVTFNSPLAIGGTSLVSATTFNASAPALRFAGTGNPSTSGLYYDSNANIEFSGVMVSDKGILVASFNKDGGFTVQNNLPINAKYLKVSGFQNTANTAVNFTSGRYLGTWDGITSGAFTAPSNPNLSAGDFVINTGGYLHIYTGSAWVLGGTNTGQPNTWSALNSFSYSTAAHAAASTYTENLYLGVNAITLSPASSGLTYPAIRSMAITGSAFSTTTANTAVSSASNLHIVGLPYRGGTVANLSTFKSYGILIDGGVDTSSTEAYGIYVNKSTYSTTATSVYYGAGFSSSQTLATTNITNVRILSSDTSTSTSEITKTGLEIISSGTWSGATGSQTNRALYIDASGGKTNYAAIFNSGQVGIGTSTPTTGFALDVNGTIRSANGITVASGGLAVSGGKVSISDTTAGSSSDGSLQLSGGLKTAQASYFGDAVTIASGGLAVSGGKVSISDTTAGSSSDGSLQLSGGLKTAKTSYFGDAVTIAANGLAVSGGKVSISDTTAGSSSDGSLQLSGGLKTAKASYFGDAVTIAANGLAVSGGINVAGSAQGALAPRAFIPAVAFIPDTGSGPSITVSNGIYVQQFSGAAQYSYAYFQAPINWARNSIKIAIYGVDASGVTWTVDYINGAPSTTFTTPVGTASTISSKSGTTSITESNYTTISLNSGQTLPAVGTGITLRIYAPAASGTAISTLYGASIIFA